MIVENTAKHQARINASVERQRNGEPDGSPWDGVPHGMYIVVDIDGSERLNRTTVDEGAMKSKDIQKNDNGAGRNEEITALLMLGRPLFLKLV